MYHHWLIPLNPCNKDVSLNNLNDVFIPRNARVVGDIRLYIILVISLKEIFLVHLFALHDNCALLSIPEYYCIKILCDHNLNFLPLGYWQS